MKKIKQQKQGISLIVLIITIIVMIIMATAIILSLDGSDIIGRAKLAKSSSDIATAKEIVSLAKSEWAFEKVEGYDSAIEYAEAKLEEAGYKVGENGGIFLSETSTGINTIYIGSDDRQAIIPEGFTVSTVSTEDTVTEGLVIMDEDENEFVWVPVDDFSKFQRTSTYNGIITAPYNSDCIEPLTSSTQFITNISLYSDEIAQYNNMRASVETNKGFYIARYEAGLPKGKTITNVKIDGTDRPVSKKNATPWTNIPWDLMAEYDWTTSTMKSSIFYGDDSNPGAALVAKKAYANSSSVVSSLCYGVQWDSALQFIYNKDANYPTNSKEKGNYNTNSSGTQEVAISLIPTGSVEAYAVNNIYDMAGNAWEWSYEANKVMAYGFRMLLGANYLINGVGTVGAAGARQYSYPNTEHTSYGFRLALYIK